MYNTTPFPKTETNAIGILKYEDATAEKTISGLVVFWSRKIPKQLIKVTFSFVEFIVVLYTTEVDKLGKASKQLQTELRKREI